MKLLQYTEIIKDFFKNELNFVDIGAFQGSVTEKLLDTFPKSKGILFEPTKNSYDILSNKFASFENIKIVRLALGNEKYETEFFAFDDAAQNSLLKVINSSTDYNKEKVQVETLDSILESLNFLPRVDFIKIDTQGNDLNVLRGGLNTIKKNKPIILTEIIFVPLYKDQGSYFEQFVLLKDLNYKLSGIYNIHYNEMGYLAFADLLLIPSTIYERVIENISPFSEFNSIDPESLFEENKKLYSVCEERLHLINELTEEAEKRLEIINRLNAELERIKRENH